MHDRRPTSSRHDTPVGSKCKTPPSTATTLPHSIWTFKPTGRQPVTHCATIGKTSPLGKPTGLLRCSRASVKRNRSSWSEKASPGHASIVLHLHSLTSIAADKYLYLGFGAFAPTSLVVKNDPLSELCPPYVFVPHERRHPVYVLSFCF